jgi:hypothetical protein
MSLIPIKLLQDEVAKNTLLNLKSETSEIDKDDYIESRIETDEHARCLLAIEDATEMAKLYLHNVGVFEQIAKDIKRESRQRFTFNCSKITDIKVRKSTVMEYILLETSYDDDSGHYGLAKINHLQGTATIYDSMVKSESDFKVPLENVLMGRYRVYESKNKLQPTGGFIAKSLEEFKEPNYSGGVPKKLLEEAFELSQYDELSQHHFCYVEAFLAMMNQIGMTHPGPGDPRDRLTFVKRVTWGLIHKYVPKEKRDSIQWRYFVKNFPYIMETWSPDNKRLRIVRGYVQVPPYKRMLKKLYLRDDIDERWSLKRIVDWAA